MGVFKELYNNIEVVITVTSVPDHINRLNWVNLDLKIYPVGQNKNEAAAIIKKELDLTGSVRFSDFTSDNVLDLTVHYLFHNSFNEIQKWIEHWERYDYKEVIQDYFISRVVLSALPIKLVLNESNPKVATDSKGQPIRFNFKRYDSIKLTATSSAPPLPIPITIHCKSAIPVMDEVIIVESNQLEEPIKVFEGTSLLEFEIARIPNVQVELELAYIDSAEQ